MFELYGEKYSNEQEIIDAGVEVIYYYCRDVKGRWRAIEHLMIVGEVWGYCYARYVIKGRYEPELEILYLMRHSGRWANWYIDELVRYGNV